MSILERSVSESEFSISFSEGMPTAVGLLTEASQIDLDLANDRAKPLSLSGLRGASWAGLDTLVRVLKSEELWQGKLTEVPIGLYEQLLSIDGEWAKEHTQSVLAGSSRLGQTDSGRLMDTSEVIMACKKMKSLGPSCDLLLVQQAIHGEGLMNLKDMKEFEGEVARYICFVATILSACSLSFAALSFRVLSQVLGILRIRKALLLFGGPSARFSAEADFNEARLIHRLKKLEGVSDVVRNMSLGLGSSLFGALSQSPSIRPIQLLGILRSFSKTNEALKSAVEPLETVGSQIIASIDHFLDPAPVQEAWMRLQSSEVSSRQKDGISRMLSVWGQRSDATWNDLCGQINGVVENLPEAGMNLIVELQQIDTLRQVLEHRMSEASALTENFSQLSNVQVFEREFEGSWGIKETSRWLVTNLEKSVFESFFPDSDLHTQGDLVSGSDVVFF